MRLVLADHGREALIVEDRQIEYLGATFQV